MDEARYRFAAPEPGGLLGTRFAPIQFAMFGLGAVVGMIVFRSTIGSLPGLITSFALAISIASLGAVPMFGYSAIEWVPHVMAFRKRPRRWHSSVFRKGHTVSTDDLETGTTPPPEPPPGISVELQEVLMPSGDGFGVFIDRKSQTYTAALQCRVGSFELLSEEDRAHKLAGWGRALQHVAREGTPVYRLQWIEGTAKSEVHDLARYFNDNRDNSLPRSDNRVASMMDVLNEAPSEAQDHDVHLVLTIDARRAAKAISRLRGKSGTQDMGACNVLLQELRSMQQSLAEFGVTVEGVLSKRSMGRLVREGYDPASRTAHAQMQSMRPEHAGVDEHNIWPLATEEGPSFYMTDGTYHSTLVISEFPRDAVGPAFLKPLLLESKMRRRVSIVMEPIAPSKARRDIRMARTAHQGNKSIKSALSDPTVSDEQREADLLAREWELNRSHGDFRFTGYVTVSAPTRETLDEHLHDLGQLGARSGGMQLRPVYMQQALAFTYTLPLGKGLE